MQVTLGSIADIPPGEGRTYEVCQRRIAVFHGRGGELYAVQASCPHRGGPLADGLVGGSTLVCPLHSWKFDLVSGRALEGDCSLETYRVERDEADQVVVELE